MASLCGVFCWFVLSHVCDVLFLFQSLLAGIEDIRRRLLARAAQSSPKKTKQALLAISEAVPSPSRPSVSVAPGAVPVSRRGLADTFMTDYSMDFEDELATTRPAAGAVDRLATVASRGSHASSGAAESKDNVTEFSEGKQQQRAHHEYAEFSEGKAAAVPSNTYAPFHAAEHKVTDEEAKGVDAVAPGSSERPLSRQLFPDPGPDPAGLDGTSTEEKSQERGGPAQRPKPSAHPGARRGLGASTSLAGSELGISDFAGSIRMRHGMPGDAGAGELSLSVLGEDEAAMAMDAAAREASSSRSTALASPPPPRPVQPPPAEQPGAASPDGNSARTSPQPRVPLHATGPIPGHLIIASPPLPLNEARRVDASASPSRGADATGATGVDDTPASAVETRASGTPSVNGHAAGTPAEPDPEHAALGNNSNFVGRRLFEAGDARGNGGDDDDSYSEDEFDDEEA